jgi:arylsulfatase A-like enzyme
LVATAVLLAFIAFFVARLESNPRASRSVGPNILVIVTDDQRTAGTMLVMPQTRHWIQQAGVRFPHAFVTTPYCCPSRVSISTGRYVHNHRVVHNWSPDVAGFDAFSTERYLQDAGYRTGIFGKYLVGWPIHDDPPHFDEWSIVQVPHGVTYYGGTVNDNGDVHPRHEYHTTFVRDQALSYLDRTEEDPRPWFLYLGFKAPHSPYTPEPRYADAPLPPFKQDPAMHEKDLSDKPFFMRSLVAPPGKAALTRAEQLRTLFSVDDAIGAIFRDLVRLGEDRDTLVVFVSDNGYMWGEHGLAARKLVPYLPSIAVPLALRWPGHIQPGTVDDRLAANIDIAPTVLAAAGVSPPADEPMDGRSLLGPDRRNRLLAEFWALGDIPSWASTVRRDYQYTEYYDKRGGVTFREYYDLATDPWELRNVLFDGDTANDPDVEALANTLAADRRCVGRSCP